MPKNVSGQSVIEPVTTAPRPPAQSADWSSEPQTIGENSARSPWRRFLNWTSVVGDMIPEPQTLHTKPTSSLPREQIFTTKSIRAAPYDPWRPKLRPTASLRGILNRQRIQSRPPLPLDSEKIGGSGLEKTLTRKPISNEHTPAGSRQQATGSLNSV
jgi:hypothetical protein